MKTKLVLLFMVLYIGAAAQGNYVINGTDWIDSDGDGLADGWYAGQSTDPDIDSGRQYGQSLVGVVEIGQYVNITNPLGRKFLLSYDISSNVLTQCRIWITPELSYMANEPNPQPVGTSHYDLTFIYTQPTIYAVEFRTVTAGWMWIDNVSLTEVFPVCIPEFEKPVTGIPEYYDLTGRRLSKPPVGCIYLQKTGNKVTKLIR